MKSPVENTTVETPLALPTAGPAIKPLGVRLSRQLRHRSDQSVLDQCKLQCTALHANATAALAVTHAVGRGHATISAHTTGSLVSAP